MSSDNRNSIFELLRIVAMLMIIFGHATQHTDGWKNLTSGFSINLLVTFALGIWAQVGVCIFVIITSFFMCEKRGIKSEKILGIGFQSWSISAIICVVIVFIVTGYTNAGEGAKMIVIKEFSTPFYGQYWFVTAYIAFYLLLPVLQFTTQNAKHESIGKAAVIMMFLVPIYNLFFSNPGGALADFVSLYFMTVYLKNCKDNFIERNCVKILVFGAAAIFFLCVCVNWMGQKFGIAEDIVIKLFGRIFVNRHILTFIVAFSVFYVFKRFSFNSRTVNLVGGCTFGVYLMHENLLIRQIWGNLLHLDDYFYNSSWYPVIFIFSVVGVFIVCTALEWLRKNTLDRVFHKIGVLNRICNRFNDWYVISETAL